MLNEQEEWKEITNYPDYMVSNTGRVRGKNKILSPCLTRRGYLRVTLYRNKKPWVTRVHVLVAAEFIGSRPEGFHIEHINHDKKDNSVANLRYCPPRENYRRGVIDKRYPSGENNKWSKLSNTQVLEIFNADEGATALSKKYGVSDYAIRCIKSGKTWSSITGKQALSKINKEG